MIKRTLCFTNPAYLSLKNEQLVVKMPQSDSGQQSAISTQQSEKVTTIPIEDIGVVVIDNRQITITSGLIDALLENNCALITCDSKSLPVGLMLPLCGNTTQSERFRHQIEASLPLKKQLWQQTIQAKINNQAVVLDNCTDAETACMYVWAKDVKSGDSENLEGRAAADGFITYLGIDKKIIVEIICIKQDLRHKGIGRGFVNDYIEYFKKRNILVVEIDNVITSEGNNLCISTGFKKLVKPNEEDITQFYKPLTRDCRKENWTANRRIVLWNKESFDSSCPPDMSWDLDFKNDKAPILEYAYKDWYVGIVENNQIIEYGMVKYFYGVANETLGYIYINNDIFRR